MSPEVSFPSWGREGSLCVGCGDSAERDKMLSTPSSAVKQLLPWSLRTDTVCSGSAHVKKKRRVAPVLASDPTEGGKRLVLKLLHSLAGERKSQTQSFNIKLQTQKPQRLGVRQGGWKEVHTGSSPPSPAPTPFLQ